MAATAAATTRVNSEIRVVDVNQMTVVKQVCIHTRYRKERRRSMLRKRCVELYHNPISISERTDVYT